MRLRLIFLILILILAACGSDDDGGDETNQALPTLAEVAADTTEEATDAIVVEQATETDEPTATEVVEESPTVEPSNTLPPTATFRPLPTQTPAPTVDRTRVAIGTGTAAVEEAVIISTVTAGANSPATTPMAVANVVITAAQFQEEVSLRIEDIQEIESARVSFVSGENPGIQVGLRASGGEALVNGTVFIPFQMTGSFVAIGGTINVEVGSGNPPQAYVDVALNHVLPAVVESFEAILKQRVGDEQDLESLEFVDATTMQIQLLVPANGP
jgi:hypothetical protein